MRRFTHGLELSAEVDGMERLRALLQEAAENAKDLTPVFRRIDRDLSGFFRLQFETSGAEGGEPWAPLAPATIAGRTRLNARGTARVSARGRARGGLFRPLWDTGRLKRSLQQVGPESIRVLRRTEYARGTSVPYAGVHQKGSKDGKIPARRFIPRRMPERYVSTWTAWAVQHLGDDL